MRFLVDEAYFDFSQDRLSILNAESKPKVVEPISDLCFIFCKLSSTSYLLPIVTLMERVQQMQVSPQQTVLSPGTSTIEHLQRSRRIKMALLDAIA